ncbi:MAG: DNA-directed RNA polymerase subunit alpha C-terminal domain-containing protein [Phycisphaerae bacterium]
MTQALASVTFDAASDVPAAKKLYEEALAVLKKSGPNYLEQAIALLEQAVAKDSEHELAMFKLASLLDLVGQDEQAIALYEILVDRCPVFEGALLNLAVLYEDHGRYVDSEVLMGRLLSECPNHAKAKLFMKDASESVSMKIDEDIEKRNENNHEMLETPVTDFELSVRARNCLKKMEIHTMGELLRVPEADLLAYKNFGDTSLDEIRKMVVAKGFRLGQYAEEQHGQMQKEMIQQQLANSVPEDILNKSLAEIELSVRSKKAVERLGANTLGELACRTEAELLGIKNFGQTSLDEIKAILTTYNLTLRKIPE